MLQMDCHENDGVVYNYTLNQIVFSVFIVMYQVSFYHITATVLVVLIFESIYLLYLIF